MSMENFSDGPGGTTFFFSPELRIDRPQSEGVTMEKKNEGYFGHGPERQFTNWLVQAAKERAKEDGTSFTAGLGKVRAENPQIAKAADLEVLGVGDHGGGESYLRIMRRALEIEKATGLPTEACLARAEVADPDLAAAARREQGGSIYASELTVAPGVGNLRVLMSDGIEAALDPGKHLSMLAEERGRRDGVSFGEGLVRVARERPDLAKASREQALGRKMY